MFLLNSIYNYVRLFFYKNEKNKFIYNDDFKTFYKFYNFINFNKEYFNIFFRRYNLNFNSNFIYLYFIYFFSKKNKLVSVGDFEFFFGMVYILNKKFELAVYRTYHIFDYILVCKKIPVLLNNFWKKKIESNNKFFNIKLKTIKLPYKNIKIASLLNLNTFLVNVNPNIRYSSSSIVKYINANTDYSIYFLRKNKSFNKGRYSRNRQNYRTGVYWCLYINILALFGLYYLFYRFTFNFGYTWWLFYCLPASFIVPQLIRNRLYNPYELYNSFTLYFCFLFNCINTIFFKK